MKTALAAMAVTTLLLTAGCSGSPDNEAAMANSEVQEQAIDNQADSLSAQADNAADAAENALSNAVDKTDALASDAGDAIADGANTVANSVDGNNATK